MEELRSTEVLDREILEDARKKAFKILSTADDNIKSRSRHWEKKTSNAVSEIRKTFEKQIHDEKAEILAKIPLDKRRLRVEITEKFILQAMDEFLRSLRRDEILIILKHELQKCLARADHDDLAREKSIISFQNMNRDEVIQILRTVFADCGIKTNNDFSLWQIEQDSKTSAFLPVMGINTPNMKITVSVENAASQILKNKRAELAAALLGMDVLND